MSLAGQIEGGSLILTASHDTEKLGSNAIIKYQDGLPWIKTFRAAYIFGIETYDFNFIHVVVCHISQMRSTYRCFPISLHCIHPSTHHPRADLQYPCINMLNIFLMRIHATCQERY